MSVAENAPAPRVLTDIDDVLTTTRAIRRRFDFDRPVPRSVIVECMELAIQAPTGGNAQDWRFVAVSDPATREALAEVYRGCFETYVREPLSAGLNAPSARGRLDRSPAAERMLAGAAYLADNIQRAPWLVLACATRPNPEQDTAAAGTTSAVYGSVYPAVWSFCLALRSRGLGSIITTLAQNREEDVARILGLPGEATQCCLLPVAYTLRTDFRRAPRKPLEEVVYWDRWNGVG